MTLSFQTRRDLLQQMIPRYPRASATQKGVLLDKIAATTGYARLYAMWQWNSIHLDRGGNVTTDRRSNMPSSWFGTQPIASVASD